MAVDTVDQKTETEEYQGPVSTYQVMEAQPLASDARFKASDLDSPEVDEPVEEIEERVESIPLPKPAAIAAAKPEDETSDKLSNKSSTRMVIALGVGLGVLGALALVAFVFLPGKSGDNSYDMGAVTSTSNGLRGHLITNWGDRLDYKLTIEPSDPGELDAFVSAIERPQQPIAVDLQLRDVSGTVLCNTPILVKFDPLVGDASPAKTEDSAGKNSKVDQTAESRAEIERSLNRARLVSQELSREHGKDIFQNVAGEDGQIASISAQGSLSCSKKQYQNAASWAFVTNFPSVLQAAGPQGMEYNGDTASFGGAPERAATAVRYAGEQRPRRNVALPSSHFSVEVDDSLVGYQAKTGIAETRSGKTFLLEKPELVAMSLKGVDLPIPIHYRCDQLGACSLAGLNAGIQRAWLEK
jgi:hypothetical protein